MNNLTPKVLEIDIVLAGKAVDEIIVNVPNPEGRDLLITGLAQWHTIVDTGGADAAITFTFGETQTNIWVQGGNVSDQTSQTYLKWSAASSLTITLTLAIAPTYVGKLYVEYWGSDRVLGTSYSKQHASVYRGIRRAL